MDEKETCVEVTYLAPYMEEVMKKLEKDKKRSRSAYLPCYAEFFYGLFYERRRSGSGSSRKNKDSDGQSGDGGPGSRKTGE